MRRCFYCGEFADTVDHVYPRALGGGDWPGNVVYACAECNQDKKSHMLNDYRAIVARRFGIEDDASLQFPGEMASESGYRPGIVAGLD